MPPRWFAWGKSRDMLGTRYLTTLGAHLLWLACALMPCGGSAEGGEAEAAGRRLEYVSLAGHPAARCLDGSPAGYYFRRGRDAQNLHDGGWVIYLEDGGFCFTEAQCREQSLTAHGSSATWPPSRDDPGGIMSKESVEDPGAVGAPLL